MVREFREEAEIVVDPEQPLRLHGFYHNRAAAGRDHVALYVAAAFSVRAPKQPDREIAACGFFPLDALPAGDHRRHPRAPARDPRGPAPVRAVAALRGGATPANGPRGAGFSACNARRNGV